MPSLDPTGKKITDRQIQTVCLMVLASVAGIYLVYWLRPVLVPFIVACFIVSGVGPILGYLENRFNVSRVVAAGMAFLLGVALMGVFGLTISFSIIDLAKNKDDYRNRVRQLVDTIDDKLSFDMLSIGQKIRDRENAAGAIEKASDVAEEPASGADTQAPRDADSDEESERNETESLAVTEPIEDQPRGTTVESGRLKEATEIVDTFVRDGISVVLQAFLSLVSTSIVVLIYVFFLLLGKPAYAQTGTMREIDSQIRGYLSLKTVISIGTGAVFGLTLRMFGVPMALSFGVLAFLLNFIPNIGPIVASLLPIPLILLDPSGNILWMISVIVATSTIQVISGNVVEPKLMGNSSDLHPVSILLGLMFWGMMWGIIGMFLATPVTAAIKIVLERFEPTRPVAEIMAGRWESTPSV